MLSQPNPPIWQSGERHLGGYVLIKPHSLNTRAESLVSVTQQLTFSTALFLLWLYKINNYPPCHQFFANILRFHGLPNPLSDKVHHFLIAQHVPDACVNQSELMSRSALDDIPSQAKTRKSQSGSTSALSMSGLQVTIWSACKYFQ